MWTGAESVILWHLERVNQYCVSGSFCCNFVTGESAGILSCSILVCVCGVVVSVVHLVGLSYSYVCYLVTQLSMLRSIHYYYCG